MTSLHFSQQEGSVTVFFSPQLLPDTEYEYKLRIYYYDSWTNPVTGETTQLLRSKESEIPTFRTEAF